MFAKITKFPNDSNWVSGIVADGEYKFQAKLYDEDSVFGINEGRISKLNIVETFTDQIVVNYDREWDIIPDEDNLHIYEEVYEVLENAPTRFI